MAIRTIWHAPSVILKGGEAASARPARYTPVQRRCLLRMRDAVTFLLLDACLSLHRQSHGDKRRSQYDRESFVRELHVVRLCLMQSPSLRDTNRPEYSKFPLATQWPILLRLVPHRRSRGIELSRLGAAHRVWTAATLKARQQVNGRSSSAPKPQTTAKVRPNVAASRARAPWSASLLHALWHLGD
jgi:hypothetical protein